MIHISHTPATYRTVISLGGSNRLTLIATFCDNFVYECLPVEFQMFFDLISELYCILNHQGGEPIRLSLTRGVESSFNYEIECLILPVSSDPLMRLPNLYSF